MLDQRSLIRTSAVVVGMVLLLKVAGMLEKVVLAATFGIEREADAALVAANGAILLGVVIFDIIGPSLIPILMGRQRGEQSRITGTLLMLWAALLALVAVGGWALDQELLSLLGPGLDEETRRLALPVLHGGLVALPLFGAAAVLGAHLNANGRYLQPALADLAFRMGPLAGLLAFGTLQGLALGFIAGAALRVLALLRLGLTPRPALAARHPDVRQSLHLAWPLLLTALISSHLFAVVESAIATTISVGAVSSLAFARRIADLPNILVPQVVARVAFPTLAGLASQPARMRAALQHTVHLSMMALLPPALLGMALAEPLVRLIYSRGAFEEQAVVTTSAALWALLPGLPAFGLGVLVLRFAYAVGDTRTPSIIRVVGAGVHILLALWMRRWGIEGIAWASTIAAWGETLVLLPLVARKLGVGPRIPHGALRAAGRLALAAAAMVLVASNLVALLPPGEGARALITHMAIVGAAGALVYAATLFLLGARLPLRGTR